MELPCAGGHICVAPRSRHRGPKPQACPVDATDGGTVDRLPSSGYPPTPRGGPRFCWDRPNPSSLRSRPGVTAGWAPLTREGELDRSLGRVVAATLVRRAAHD